MPRDVGVVIVAGGKGERLGTAIAKQYLLLAGSPVLLHAIRPFASHPDVAHVVIVLPAADVDAPPQWLADIKSQSLTLVGGGTHRSDSVAAGLATLPASCGLVLVHDGARPFPPRDVLDASIAVARTGHSAVPALPVGETIKRADDYGRILATVPRDGLWRAQTPQSFPRLVLERAHAAGRADGIIATDDASLVERIGETVELIAGSVRNIKITTADDLALAEWMAGRA